MGRLREGVLRADAAELLGFIRVGGGRLGWRVRAVVGVPLVPLLTTGWRGRAYILNRCARAAIVGSGVCIVRLNAACLPGVPAGALVEMFESAELGRAGWVPRPSPLGSGGSANRGIRLSRLF